jgi:ketosteroid isomerase-like protein
VSELDVKALLDRAAINDVLDDYAAGIDGRDFGLVASLFTDDAQLDYTTSGGPTGDRDAVMHWLRETLPAVALTQHLLVNRRIRVDGDTATASTDLFNPLLFGSDDNMQVLLLGGRYDDELIRTQDGWRISRRVHTTTWTAGPFHGELSTPEA